jgi:hypothetical protein
MNTETSAEPKESTRRLGMRFTPAAREVEKKKPQFSHSPAPSEESSSRAMNWLALNMLTGDRAKYA